VIDDVTESEDERLGAATARWFAFWSLTFAQLSFNLCHGRLHRSLPLLRPLLSTPYRVARISERFYATRVRPSPGGILFWYQTVRFEPHHPWPLRLMLTSPDHRSSSGRCLLSLAYLGTRPAIDLGTRVSAPLLCSRAPASICRVRSFVGAVTHFFLIAVPTGKGYANFIVLQASGAASFSEYATLVLSLWLPTLVRSPRHPHKSDWTPRPRPHRYRSSLTP
jgi:hypothetical protein